MNTDCHWKGELIYSVSQNSFFKIMKGSLSLSPMLHGPVSVVIFVLGDVKMVGEVKLTNNKGNMVEPFQYGFILSLALFSLSLSLV